MSRVADGGTFWRNPGWPNPAWIYTNAPALSHPGYRLSEMMAPNVPPMRLQAPGRAAGSIPSLGYLGQNPTTTMADPVFKDVNGAVITQAVCGSVYSLTIPGWEGKTVYAVQTKNGAPQFSGPFPIPMSNYASNCAHDPGTYQFTAFDPNNKAVIGSTVFTVLPAAATTPASSTGTTPASTTASSSTSSSPTTAGQTNSIPPAPGDIVIGGFDVTTFFSSLTAPWLIAGGIVLLFLLTSGGRRR